MDIKVSHPIIPTARSTAKVLMTCPARKYSTDVLQKPLNSRWAVFPGTGVAIPLSHAWSLPRPARRRSMRQDVGSMVWIQMVQTPSNTTTPKTATVWITMGTTTITHLPGNCFLSPGRLPRGTWNACWKTKNGMMMDARHEKAKQRQPNTKRCFAA